MKGEKRKIKTERREKLVWIQTLQTHAVRDEKQTVTLKQELIKPR